MMDLFKKVTSGEALALLADGFGNVVWETSKSPVSALYHAYFANEFSDLEDLVLYADQAGIAMGIMAGKIPVKECRAVKMSRGGLLVFQENKVAATYDEIIPLVKSSKDDSKVCPIEQFLFDHKDGGEQWEFLEGQYR